MLNNSAHTSVLAPIWDEVFFFFYKFHFAIKVLSVMYFNFVCGGNVYIFFYFI